MNQQTKQNPEPSQNTSGWEEKIMRGLNIAIFVSVLILPAFVDISSLPRRILDFVLFSAWLVCAFLFRKKMKFSKPVIFLYTLCCVLSLVSFFVPGGVLIPHARETIDSWLHPGR